MSNEIPPLPARPPGWSQMQVWWQQVTAAISSQFTDITEALADMPDLSPQTVYADYAGVPQTDQLPRSVRAYRYQGSSDVSDESEWGLTVESGSVTATVSASGVVNITALDSSTAVLVVTSTYNGVAKSRKLSLTRVTGSAPTSGSGGGGSASDSSFNSINSSAMAAISDELTVAAGAGGNVSLTAPLTVTVGGDGGPNKVYGIWRWWNGASYVDVGAEVGSSPDPSRFIDVSESPPVVESDPGTLSVSNTKTGLTPSSSYKFQLYARNASGTRTCNFSGTASAVGN